MNKRLIGSILLIMTTWLAFGQDLVITQNGDSVNCKINQITKKYILFTYKQLNEQRNAKTPIVQIKDYKYNFYSEYENYAPQKKDSITYSRFRLSINSGYSYQLAILSEDIPGEFRDYFNKLKSGYHIGAEASYFYDEYLGIGIKSCLFKTTNQINNIYYENENGVRTFGKMSDEIIISFWGPSFVTRYLNDKLNSSFLLSLSVGQVNYLNNKVFFENYILTGKNIGYILDFGGDIKVFNNLYTGFKLSLLSANLSKYTIDDGKQKEIIDLEPEEYEGLSRFDISIGIRYIL